MGSTNLTWKEHLDVHKHIRRLSSVTHRQSSVLIVVPQIHGLTDVADGPARKNMASVELYLIGLCRKTDTPFGFVGK